MSSPVLIPHCKFHTGIVKALVVHPVCQHCCLRKVLQCQAKLELLNTAVYQLPYLRTSFKASQSCPTFQYACQEPPI